MASKKIICMQIYIFKMRNRLMRLVSKLRVRGSLGQAMLMKDKQERK